MKYAGRVKFFIRFLINRSTSDVRALALGFSTLVFALLVVKVQPFLTHFDPLIQVLIAAVSLGTCVTFSEWFLQFCRTKKVRGQWIYRSSAGNWGLACIKQIGFDISYEVQLFATESGLQGALTNQPVPAEEILGHTVSEFCEYQDGVVSIRYIIQRSANNYEKREGFLELVPHGIEENALTGYWTSTLNGAHGELYITRPNNIDSLRTNEKVVDAAKPTVHVIGIGLIGGSCALRIKEKGWNVVGHDIDTNTLEAARARGISINEQINDQDLVILAGPTPIVAEQIRQGIASNAHLVVDVCSVKAAVIEAVNEVKITNFVSLHPMAGSEKSGFTNAKSNLLTGAVWALCPTEYSQIDLVNEAISWVKDVFDGRVCVCRPSAHDEAVSVISHLPHALSLALLARPGRSQYGDLAAVLSAGSFRDGTRVAHGNGLRIGDMLCENAHALAKTTQGAVHDLQELHSYLQTANTTDIRNWIELAQDDEVKKTVATKWTIKPNNQETIAKICALGEKGWIVDKIQGDEICLQRT